MPSPGPAESTLTVRLLLASEQVGMKFKVAVPLYATEHARLTTPAKPSAGLTVTVFELVPPAVSDALGDATDSLYDAGVESTVRLATFEVEDSQFASPE